MIALLAALQAWNLTNLYWDVRKVGRAPDRLQRPAAEVWQSLGWPVPAEDRAV